MWQIPFFVYKRKKDVVLEFVLYSGIHQSFWADVVKGNVSYCDHFLEINQSAIRIAYGGHVC
jgi:hypothetical protein